MTSADQFHFFFLLRMMELPPRHQGPCLPCRLQFNQPCIYFTLLFRLVTTTMGFNFFFLKWVSLALGNKHAACFSRFASRLNVLPFRRVLLTALVPLLLHLIMDMPAHIIAFCRWLPLCLARPASLRSLSEPCVVVLAPSLSPRIGKCLIPKHAAENRSSASRM